MSTLKPDSDTSPSATSYTTPPALIAFPLAVVVLCFVGFSIVYFCRCYFVSVIHTRSFQRTASGTFVHLSPNSSPFRGLDPFLLQTFPTFPYASVKDLRKDNKYSLECAICLLEFEEDSMLRLLTLCCHVFHQECIDLWLRSHKTCPVCRIDLDSPTNETRKSPELREDNHRDVEHDRRESLTEGEICIDVKDDERHDDETVSMSTRLQEEQQGEQRFARSHSTGHSIVLIRGRGEGIDDDKYTLRLPERVEFKIMGGGHNYRKSCPSYKEMTGPAVAAAPCSNCGCVQTVSGYSSRSNTESM